MQNILVFRFVASGASGLEVRVSARLLHHLSVSIRSMETSSFMSMETLSSPASFLPVVDAGGRPECVHIHHTLWSRRTPTGSKGSLSHPGKRRYRNKVCLSNQNKIHNSPHLLGSEQPKPPTEKVVNIVKPKSKAKYQSLKHTFNSHIPPLKSRFGLGMTGPSLVISF